MSSQGRIVVGVLALVAVIAGFWLLALAPKRADVSSVSESITQAEQRRDAAVASAAQAEQARSRYQQDYETVARLGKAVPQDDDMASLVYQLETIARANKVDFRALKLTASAAAATPAAAPAPKEGEGEPGAGAAAPVAPVVAQPPPGAVVGTAGLLTVPFTFTFDGSYLQMQRFLKAIDGLANGKKEKITVRGRLLTVDGFALAAGRDGFPRVKATVSATAFLVPPADATAAAAAPPQPAGTAGAPTTTAMITPDAQGAGR